MKKQVTINLNIERLPEGVYIATSSDVQGLVAQAKTIEKVIEISESLAKTLISVRKTNFIPSDKIFYPMRISV